MVFGTMFRTWMMILLVVSLPMTISALLDMEFAKAQELGCCEETTGGEYCQYTTEDQCTSSDFNLNVDCDATPNCRKVCCLDPNEGTCEETRLLPCDEAGGSSGAPGQACEDIPACKVGCCLFPDSGVLTTFARCQKLQNNLTPNFNPSLNTWEACNDAVPQQDLGCCILGTTCTRTTQNGCDKIGGISFIPDGAQPTYCSDLSECDMCENHNYRDCVNWDNNVHWFDSCGNEEGIAEDCIDSVCVDGKCKGECKDPRGNTRAHGESWCIYDVDPTYYDVLSFDPNTNKIPIGVVGSRDFRAVCRYGEIYIEPCMDYRQEICVQNTTEKTASCVLNMWAACLISSKEECKANPHCVWDITADWDMKDDKWVKPGDDDWRNAPLKDAYKVYQQASCLPRYPPGFPFLKSVAKCKSLDKEACGKDYNCVWRKVNGNYQCISQLNILSGIATANRGTEFGCQVKKIQVKKISLCKSTKKLDGIERCDCKELAFKNALARKCTALGDSGANINIAGKLSRNGFTVYKAYKDDDETKVDPSTDWKSGYLSKVEDKIAGLGPRESFIEGTKRPALQDLGLDYTKALRQVSEGEEKTLKDWVRDMEQLGISDLDVRGLITGIYTTVGLVIAIAVPGIGWILGTIITAVSGFLGYIVSTYINFLLSKIIDEKYWTFVCSPWKAPSGAQDCDLCNKDPMRPCSEYRCRSLGACKFVGAGTDNSMCKEMEDDGKRPRIKGAESLTEGYKVKDFSEGPPNGGFDFEGPGKDDCFRIGDRVSIKLKLSEWATCKYGFEEDSAFEDMLLISSGKELIWYFSPIFPPFERTAYIICEDNFGHQFDVPYPVSFCVERVDRNPPQITATFPEDGWYFPYDTNKIKLSIFVNENATCRWSKKESDKFTEMGLECRTELLSGKWVCNTELTGLKQLESNSFYIRCNDTEGNVADPPGYPAYNLTFYGSDPLIINITKPKEGSAEPGCEIGADTKLEVETSGGAQEGKTLCYWTNKSGWTNLTLFESDAFMRKKHSTNVPISEGSNTLYVQCSDESTTTRNSTTFTAKIDNTPPGITRIYYDRVSEKLVIHTNESSTCAYSDEDKKCNFEIEWYTLDKFDQSNNNLTHTTGWESDKTWYVKCEDMCGNELPSGQCTAIITAQELE